MNLTNKLLYAVERMLEKIKDIYNITADLENNIINLDYNGKSYRLIIEEIEAD